MIAGADPPQSVVPRDAAQAVGRRVIGEREIPPQAVGHLSRNK